MEGEERGSVLTQEESACIPSLLLTQAAQPRPSRWDLGRDHWWGLGGIMRRVHAW